MNSMFDRLGSYIRTYLDDEQDIFSTQDTAAGREAETPPRTHTDTAQSDSNRRTQQMYSSTDTDTKQNTKTFSFSREPPRRRMPAELYSDFTKLGLVPGASWESCKSAHKKLLKQYHPDRHANDPVALMHANEKAAIINASFQRISSWFKNGKLE